MRILLDFLSQLLNYPMTLGSNKTITFSGIYKNEPKKRKPTEDMNGFMSDDNFNDNQRHVFEDNCYERPSKRCRIELPTTTTMARDLNTDTQRQQKSGFIDFFQQKWDRLKRRFKNNPISETEIQPTVDNSVVESTSRSETPVIKTNQLIDSSVPVLEKKNHRFFQRYRFNMAEKMRYKALLKSHTSKQKRESIVTFHKPEVIDLTSSSGSLVSNKRQSDQLFTAERLDLTTKTDLINRIKSTGLISPNNSLFGQKNSPLSQTLGVYSTPKFNKFSETSLDITSQSRVSPMTVPDSSKKFIEMCQTKRDYLNSDFTTDLRESLNKSNEYSALKVTKTESFVNLCKIRREADNQSINSRLKTPINRTELYPYIPFIGFDDKIEEEEEEEDEEEDEESTPSDFPLLTDDMQREIDSALVSTPRNRNDILSEGFDNLEIRRKDMETLNGLNWLNDEIINFYMSMIMERAKNDNYPNVHAFNTFFYPKLIDKKYGPKSLMRWTRKVDVFDKDFVFIPIHLGMHWCLAVINFINKRIEYYDSMGGDNNECLKLLKSWLQLESLDKKKKEYPMTDWSVQNVKDIPQQMNGSDCGMFTCKYAEYISRKAKINFSQAHMPYFRRRMVYEILNKQLL